MLQAHLRPCLWQTWRHGEAVQACGTNAEETFGDDAGVEGALGRQVSLVTLGPCLYGIRHMAAEQACAGVILQEPEGALRVARHECAAQGIEGGAVPEGLAAGLCQHAVLGPQAWRIQGVDSAFGAVEDVHGQRNAYPRAQHRVAFVVAVGVKALHLGMEIAVDGAAQLTGLLLVASCHGGRSLQVARQIGCRQQCVVV